MICACGLVYSFNGTLPLRHCMVWIQGTFKEVSCEIGKSYVLFLIKICDLYTKNIFYLFMWNPWLVVVSKISVLFDLLQKLVFYHKFKIKCCISFHVFNVCDGVIHQGRCECYLVAHDATGEQYIDISTLFMYRCSCCCWR